MLKKITIGFLIFVDLFLITIPVIFVFSDYHTLFLEGNSMYPTIPDNSLIVWKATKEVELRHIIIFDHQSYIKGLGKANIPKSVEDEVKKIAAELIVHRIVRQDKNFYATKGDNNKDIDILYVRKEDIKGIYLFHIPLSGYINKQ